MSIATKRSNRSALLRKTHQGIVNGAKLDLFAMFLTMREMEKYFIYII